MQSVRSRLIGSKTWVELFEVFPPRSASIDDLIHDLPPPGYGILLIADNPIASPAMSGSAAAVHLIRNGYNPILMLNCRDRNRIDLQSVVLGALSLGVRFFLIHPGTHQSLGSMREAKNVYDVDPIQSLKILNDMRKRHILSNRSQIAVIPEFFIGLFEHPMHGDLDMKPYFFRKKVWHSVDFIVTDPVTDFERLEAWRQSISTVEGSENIPIFIGLPDVRSAIPDSLKNSGQYAGVFYPKSE